MESQDVKHRHVTECPSRNFCHTSYHIVYKNAEYSVCHRAFYIIHGITEKHVRTALAKQTVTATTEPDKHGKGSLVDDVPEKRRCAVLEHIKSLLKVSSDYSQAKVHKGNTLPSLFPVSCARTRPHTL